MAWTAIWALIAIAAIIIVVGIASAGLQGGVPATLACGSDRDCVPATCCHPGSVINRAYAPDCSDIVCTQVCQASTMDCGCGVPVCRAGKCEVSWNPDCQRVY